MEILDGVGNEIRLRNLVMRKDVIIAFHDKLSCQSILAFVGVGTAAGSEEEDVSSTWGMRPCC